MYYNPCCRSTKYPSDVEHIRNKVDDIPKIHYILEQAIRIKRFQFTKHETLKIIIFYEFGTK